jgi:hypothetical protein
MLNKVILGWSGFQEGGKRKGRGAKIIQKKEQKTKQNETKNRRETEFV